MKGMRGMGLWTSGRTWLLSGLLVCTSAVAQDTPTLPKFEFRDLRAGDPAPEKGCAKIGDGRRMCVDQDIRIAGLWAKSMSVFYGYAGLEAVLLTVPKNDGPTLRSALVAKYGEPCRTRTNVMQNAYGAQFERETATWCFADGEADYRSISTKIDEASFYFSVPSKRPAAPVVDF